MQKKSAFLEVLESIVAAIDISLLMMLVIAALSLWVEPSKAEVLHYPVAYVDVNADSVLNVRETPGGELTSWALKAWKDVVILERSGRWALVNTVERIGEHKPPIGWVCTDYLVVYREIVQTKRPVR